MSNRDLFTELNSALVEAKNHSEGKLTLKKYDTIAKKHATYTETKKNLGRNEVKARKS